MFRNISLWQILIVVLIIALLFGARRLPDLASSVGKSLKIFKKEVTELRDDDSGTTTSSTSSPPSGATTSTDEPPSAWPGAQRGASSSPDRAPGAGDPGADTPGGSTGRS